MKYAGVVVTFNRKEDLKKNIQRVLCQKKIFDNFYIIDNHSTDGTFSYLQENNVNIDKYVGDECNNIKERNPTKKGTRIIYIELSSNIGGAGGFNIGMQKAYEDGNDFIVLMDDDGRPVRNDCFELLYNQAELMYKNNKKLMINSLVVGSDEDTTEKGCESTQILSFGLGNVDTLGKAYSSAENGMIKELINPFNGTLVTKELLEEIGYVNKDFFIRGDEVDFQSRAQKAGATIATIVNSVYYHPASELFPINWFGKTVYVGTAEPWKTYYLVRNYVYRIKRDRGSVHAYKFLFFQLYIHLKVDKNWRSCINMMFRGFRDGIKGRLGKIVQPGEK